MAVTDGNMTHTDKLDLQQMLKESQKELENLRNEKESLLEQNANLLKQREGLLEHVKVLEEQFDLSDAKPENADSAKVVQGKKSDTEKLRQNENELSETPPSEDAARREGSRERRPAQGAAGGIRGDLQPPSGRP